MFEKTYYISKAKPTVAERLNCTYILRMYPEPRPVWQRGHTRAYNECQRQDLSDWQKTGKIFAIRKEDEESFLNLDVIKKHTLGYILVNTNWSAKIELTDKNVFFASEWDNGLIRLRPQGM